MNRIWLVVVITLELVIILNSPHVSTYATESGSASAVSNDLGEDLKSKINNAITNALNHTGSVLNSSILANASNLTSSNVIISNNKIMSTISNSGSDGSSSIMKDQVITVNGVCTSIKVGGNGNDSLVSTGNCNDELTGGPGADKFTCNQGNDTIIDYDPKEGDVITDRQNCENIL